MKNNSTCVDLDGVRVRQGKKIDGNVRVLRSSGTYSIGHETSLVLECQDAIKIILGDKQRFSSSDKYIHQGVIKVYCTKGDHILESNGTEKKLAEGSCTDIVWNGERWIRFSTREK